MANSSASNSGISGAVGTTGIPVFHPIAGIMPSSFTNKTLAERASAGPMTHIYSRFANPTKCVKGIVSPLYNKDTNTCISVCQLAGPFESTTDSIYSDPKYNKFRAPLAWHYTFPVPVSISEIEQVCGMKKSWELGPGSVNSFVRPYDAFSTPRYKGENEALVKARFEALVAKWVAEAKESMAPKKAETEDRTEYWHYSM